MPELPEVETTVRGLERVLKGRRIARVEARRPDLRRALPVDLGQRLTGAHVTALRRRAKYGLIDTDRGDTLVFHLGMSGHWRIDPSETAKHDHFIIDTDDGRRVSSLPLRACASQPGAFAPHSALMRSSAPFGQSCPYLSTYFFCA